MDKQPPAGPPTMAKAPDGFAGIDSSQFPGLEITADLKRQTNLVWLGYYLVAPSHHDGGWRGKRADLVAQGWGLAPLYVGQQTIGPGSHVVTAAQGALDGGDAAVRMAAEAFPGGSTVFLDLENGPPLGARQRSYVTAWCGAVNDQGFTAGIYCSHLLADALALQNPDAPIWLFRILTTARTTSDAPFPSPAPAQSGFAPATIWQREQNVWLPKFGLLVDLDVATSADPAHPIVEA